MNLSLDQHSHLKHALTVFGATVLTLIAGALLNDKLSFSKEAIMAFLAPTLSTAIRAAWNAYLAS